MPRSKPENPVRALAEKGDGTLVNVGGVWTYSGAPLDPVATNLRLPLEHATVNQVAEAVAAGIIRPSAVQAGVVVAYRLVSEDEPHAAPGEAGTVEAATEMPAGSRPTHDAGVAS